MWQNAEGDKSQWARRRAREVVGATESLCSNNNPNGVNSPDEKMLGRRVERPTTKKPGCKAKPTVADRRSSLELLNINVCEVQNGDSRKVRHAGHAALETDAYQKSTLRRTVDSGRRSPMKSIQRRRKTIREAGDARDGGWMFRSYAHFVAHQDADHASQEEGQGAAASRKRERKKYEALLKEECFKLYLSSIAPLELATPNFVPLYDEVLGRLDFDSLPVIMVVGQHFGLGKDQFVAKLADVDYFPLDAPFWDSKFVVVTNEKNMIGYSKNNRPQRVKIGQTKKIDAMRDRSFEEKYASRRIDKMADKCYHCCPEFCRKERPMDARGRRRKQQQQQQHHASAGEGFNTEFDAARNAFCHPGAPSGDYDVPPTTIMNGRDAGRLCGRLMNIDYMNSSFGPSFFAAHMSAVLDKSETLTRCTILSCPDVPEDPTSDYCYEMALRYFARKADRIYFLIDITADIDDRLNLALEALAAFKSRLAFVYCMPPNYTDRGYLLQRYNMITWNLSKIFRPDPTYRLVDCPQATNCSMFVTRKPFFDKQSISSRVREDVLPLADVYPPVIYFNLFRTCGQGCSLFGRHFRHAWKDTYEVSSFATSRLIREVRRRAFVAVALGVAHNYVLRCRTKASSPGSFNQSINQGMLKRLLAKKKSPAEMGRSVTPVIQQRRSVFLTTNSINQNNRDCLERIALNKECDMVEYLDEVLQITPRMDSRYLNVAHALLECIKDLSIYPEFTNHIYVDNALINECKKAIDRLSSWIGVDQRQRVMTSMDHEEFDPNGSFGEARAYFNDIVPTKHRITFEKTFQKAATETGMDKIPARLLTYPDLPEPLPPGASKRIVNLVDPSWQDEGICREEFISIMHLTSLKSAGFDLPCPRPPHRYISWWKRKPRNKVAKTWFTEKGARRAPTAAQKLAGQFFNSPKNYRHLLIKPLGLKIEAQSNGELKVIGSLPKIPRVQDPNNPGALLNAYYASGGSNNKASRGGGTQVHGGGHGSWGKPAVTSRDRKPEYRNGPPPVSSWRAAAAIASAATKEKETKRHGNGGKGLLPQTPPFVPPVQSNKPRSIMEDRSRKLSGAFWSSGTSLINLCGSKPKYIPETKPRLLLPTINSLRRKVAPRGQALVSLNNPILMPPRLESRSESLVKLGRVKAVTALVRPKRTKEEKHRRKKGDPSGDGGSGDKGNLVRDGNNQAAKQNQFHDHHPSRLTKDNMCSPGGDGRKKAAGDSANGQSAAKSSWATGSSSLAKQQKLFYSNVPVKNEKAGKKTSGHRSQGGMDLIIDQAAPAAAGGEEQSQKAAGMDDAEAKSDDEDPEIENRASSGVDERPTGVLRKVTFAALKKLPKVLSPGILPRMAFRRNTANSALRGAEDLTDQKSPLKGILVNAAIRDMDSSYGNDTIISTDDSSSCRPLRVTSEKLSELESLFFRDEEDLFNPHDGKEKNPWSATKKRGIFRRCCKHVRWNERVRVLGQETSFTLLCSDCDTSDDEATRHAKSTRMDDSLPSPTKITRSTSMTEASPVMLESSPTSSHSLLEAARKLAANKKIGIVTDAQGGKVEFVNLLDLLALASNQDGLFDGEDSPMTCGAGVTIDQENSEDHMLMTDGQHSPIQENDDENTHHDEGQHDYQTDGQQETDEDSPHVHEPSTKIHRDLSSESIRVEGGTESNEDIVVPMMPGDHSLTALSSRGSQLSLISANTLQQLRTELVNAQRESSSLGATSRTSLGGGAGLSPDPSRTAFRSAPGQGVRPQTSYDAMFSAAKTATQSRVMTPATGQDDIDGFETGHEGMPAGTPGGGSGVTATDTKPKTQSLLSLAGSLKYPDGGISPMEDRRFSTLGAREPKGSGHGTMASTMQPVSTVSPSMRSVDSYTTDSAPAPPYVPSMVEKKDESVQVVQEDGPGGVGVAVSTHDTSLGGPNDTCPAEQVVADTGDAGELGDAGPEESGEPKELRLISFGFEPVAQIAGEGTDEEPGDAEAEYVPRPPLQFGFVRVEPRKEGDQAADNEGNANPESEGSRRPTVAMLQIDDEDPAANPPDENTNADAESLGGASAANVMYGSLRATATSNYRKEDGKGVVDGEDGRAGAEVVSQSSSFPVSALVDSPVQDDKPMLMTTMKVRVVRRIGDPHSAQSLRSSNVADDADSASEKPPAVNSSRFDDGKKIDGDDETSREDSN